MPLRADTFYFCVHSYIKKHKLREWLTVDEARALLKNRKVGIDAANNCISRPGDETPLDVEAHMKQLGRLVFLYLGLGAIPVVIVDPVYAHPGSLKSYTARRVHQVSLRRRQGSAHGHAVRTWPVFPSFDESFFEATATNAAPRARQRTRASARSFHRIRVRPASEL